MLKMTSLDLADKRVLLREDFNVPMKKGRITNDARIQAALPTLLKLLEDGAKVMVMSHLGRPTEGQYDAEFSLAPVAEYLARWMPVRFEEKWLEGVELFPGEIVLFENVRFNVGEEANDETLARKMAALCDVFVMDAFGSAHRAHASTEGVAHFAPVACAGPLLVAEVEALDAALKHPKKPLVGIIGGSKVSTKMDILYSLIDKVDKLIVGGGIANTFLCAQGFPVGRSLCEHDKLEEAKSILAKAQEKQVEILLPLDVVVANECTVEAPSQIKKISEVGADEMILDVGPLTSSHYTKQLVEAGTILWNGPVGVFEIPQFAKGTRALGEAIVKSSAFSLAGGGDTLAAIDNFKLKEGIGYISTGGGAFLEYVEGKTLPAIAALHKRAT